MAVDEPKLPNTYIEEFEVTDKTARTDLKVLTEENFVEKIGKTKGAYFCSKGKLPK